MLIRLLSLLWRLLNLIGFALSLRRWWRTLRDDQASRQERYAAAGILLFMTALLVWSVAQLGNARASLDRAPQVAVAPAAAASPDQIVVDFRDELSLAAIDRLDDQLGVRFEPNSPESLDERLMVAEVRHLSAAARSELLATLRRDARVEAADENFTMSVLGSAAPLWEPNDPRYKEQWSFPAIGMPAAWTKTTGKGVVVAVIDTGVAFEADGKTPAASDLKQTRWTKPYDFIRNKAKAYDDHGHGTHVAGTIAQSTNNGHGCAGIAYEATIMPLKVLSGGGSGTLSDIADAIHFAADNGAQVINMSLGGPRGAAVLAQAVRYAHARRVVVVCAAGNTASEGVCYPAAYPECIAVSAVGPSGELTFYSTYGNEICLAAPGGEYRSPDERGNGILQNTVFQQKDVFEAWQGTSMASPHVAGVAALLVQQGFQGPEAVRLQLRSTATKKDDPKKYGAGVLNAAKAVGASGAESTFVARPPRVRGTTWWPLLLGFAGWPYGAVLLLFGIRRLRPLLALGTTAFAVGCLTAAFSGVAGALWLVLNGLLAGALGWLVWRPRR
ncbi:MAG: peptidase S8 [Fimbriimonadaceae bacterium]|nr:peptidase S8 [Fimbriimonadaceae bacterium]